MKQNVDDRMLEDIATFAAQWVAGRPDLQTGQEFPSDIWRKMGQAGFFRIGVAEIYGGSGGGYLSLSKAGDVFVRSGHNLGLAVSWLYQQMIAHYLVTVFGTPYQKRRYLRALAEGKITVSFAVSEPGRGAHPKMLTTSAHKLDSLYLLNGEKTYLTNGPIAGVFIVVAVTDPNPVQKRFTAFIVPRNREGLSVMSPMPMSFLKPSPHGGIELRDCRVSEKSILGEPGGAWRDMVVPLGDIEDVVMMGPATGAMAGLMAMLIASIRQLGGEPDHTLLAELGSMSALLQSMRAMAYDAADRMDQGKGFSAPVLITFVRLAAGFLSHIDRIIEAYEIPMPAEFADLQRDAGMLITLKRRLMQIRQEKIGAYLMKNG